jgi:RNA polymerase subunit RPABC4/transcription elongation factor Spt4
MALFNCKACGGAVSVQAKTCPTCGANLVSPNAAQGNLIGCLVLIGIAAAIGFGMKACGDNTSSAPPTAA